MIGMSMSGENLDGSPVYKSSQSTSERPKKLTRKEKKEQKKRDIIVELKLKMSQIFHKNCYVKEGNSITPTNFEDLKRAVTKQTIDYLEEESLL